MLFKTTIELTSFLPVSVNFEFSRITPFIKSVEQQFIKDILGSALYTALETAYQDETIADENLALLPYCQEAIAFLAYEKYIPIGNVNVSDSGIHISVNENSKQAFNWQITDLRRSLEEEGYNKLQALLQFLWDSDSESYTAWRESTAATKYRAHYLNSATEINEFVDIKGAFRTFWLMRPSLRKIEDLQIKPIIESWVTGKHAELLAAIAAGTALTGNDLAVVELIKPALAHLALAHATMVQAIEVSSMGVVENSIEGTDQREQKRPANQTAKYNFINARNTDGRAYLDLLTTKIDELLGTVDDDDETTYGYNDTDRGVFGML